MEWLRRRQQIHNIFRRKGIAPHVDSASTNKTAELIEDEKVETVSRRKRKLTQAEINQNMVETQVLAAAADKNANDVTATLCCSEAN